MKLKNILPIAALALMATACDYQKNNTIKQKDLHKGDEYVYGVHPDSAAVQSKLKYDTTGDQDGQIGGKARYRGAFWARRPLRQ